MTRTRRRKIGLPGFGATRRLVVAALAASLVATCGVVDSTRIDPIFAGVEQQTCLSELGTYALPKAFVHVKVGQTNSTTAPDMVPFPVSANVALSTTVEVIRHPDRSLVFCMDYLGSPFHHDKVTVRKFPATTLQTTANPNLPTTSFLGAVMVNVQDRTVFIVEALLRAAFIAASGQPDFAPRDVTTDQAILADLEYDPFDTRETAEINQRLTSLGICLVLEGGFTFDRDHLTVDRYCNAPRAGAAWLTPIVKAYVKAEETPVNPRLPGLMYRPRVPYRIAIFRKPDPKGPGRWQLSETRILKLENLSPVLSLDIRRTVFAGRAANFIFDAGALLTACVAKGSEVEGFVDIPFQISRSIVALPSAILKVRIDQIGNEQSLLEAETQLVKVQAAYLAALSSGNFTAPSGTPSSFMPPGKTSTASLDVPSDLTNNPINGMAPSFGGDLFQDNSAADNLNNLCSGKGN